MKRNRLTQPITSKPNYQEIIDKLELTTASASEVDFGEIFMDENMQEAVGTSTAKTDLQNLNNEVKGLIDGNATSFTIPEGTTRIRSYAFNRFTTLKNINIPESVTSIGQSAFGACTSLELDSLPSGLTTIAYSGFDGCTKLALTSLPSGIKTLDMYAFANCTKLALTSLPSTVKTITQDSFQNCTGLTTLTFEGTPTSIQSNAFRGCTNLTTMYVPWAEGEVANSPWGAVNASIIYSHTP